MNSTDLLSWLTDATTQWQDSHDELTELDSVAGDGDLGFTVKSGAREISSALAELPENPTIAQVLRASGAGFARGNPSSFAALGSAALLAAAKAVGDEQAIDHDTALAALDAGAAKITERGGATLGDRTVMDALLPSIEALRAQSGTLADQLSAMIAAASDGVEATKEMTPARGRAAWTGERGRGYPDGGATAYLRLLETLANTAR